MPTKLAKEFKPTNPMASWPVVSAKYARSLVQKWITFLGPFQVDHVPKEMSYSMAVRGKKVHLEEKVVVSREEDLPNLNPIGYLG